MARKERRTFKPDFKAKVALEAIRGLKSITEIASKFQVSPNQIIQWKNQVVKNIDSLFDNHYQTTKEDQEAIISKLYEEIGRLKVENDWFKKK